MTHLHSRSTSTDIERHMREVRALDGATSGAWAHPPRVRRSFIAGFNWPLFALLVLLGILALGIGAALFTHATNVAQITAKQAVERGKY